MEKKEICRRVRTSGETNTSPSQLAQFAQGSLGGRRQMYKRRKPRRIDPSPLGLAHPHTLRVYYPLLFLIKLSCNQAITLVCHFNIQIFAVVRQNQENYILPQQQDFLNPDVCFFPQIGKLFSHCFFFFSSLPL